MKILRFVIICLVLVGLCYAGITYLDKKTIVFGDTDNHFEISSKNLNDIIINDKIPSDIPLGLCSISQNKCMVIKKGEIK